ncbi:pilus assembly protein [Shewanella submarina]|uniref:TadE/TadG family type IV pilus assembly protein n=1 Tax=Shewanella submarina TaxID=2016376 RepID=A0ABV7GAE4_9GAMM|nr:TadE family protein [Shewanella submarina]MCL1037386.1 pilus assembly protein [Shewanella submarina]
MMYQKVFNQKGFQSGQSLTEYLIVMPIFFALLFGIFEFAYIYRAKTTLNTATFETARAGALNNAQLIPMREALIKGMIPLRMQGEANSIQMLKSYGLTKAEEFALNKISKTVTIVSPTKAIFNKFKVQRKTTLVNDSRDIQRWVIPNDNLLLRSNHQETIDGKKLNIQDANILKIKTLWCYQLKVPILRELLVDSLSSGFLGQTSPEQLACNQMARLGDPRLAIVSQATIRMQSHIVSDGNLK